MILREVWSTIESEVFARPSRENLFNPYHSRLVRLVDTDRPRAAYIRRDNLRRYVDSFAAQPSLLVVGEAPGPLGCRFSGVPFASERQLCSGELPFGGRQSSSAEFPYHERTAEIFWEVMAEYSGVCFVWNAVPMLPHLPGRPSSLRRPSASEVREFAGLLSKMICLLKPGKIIAIGRVAERALWDIGQRATYVRHPSHGGAKEFRAGMVDLISRAGNWTKLSANADSIVGRVR